MSLYSLKMAGIGAVQPWSQAVTLAEAGKGCDGLFGLYDSLGDKTLVGANTVATLLDGPEKVVRYGALTMGDGTTPTSLTAANRCKGLVILCDSLTVKANATLHMTGRGARVLTNDDPFFPFIDYRIPFKISLDSSRMTLAQALAVIKSQGLAPWDVGTFQHVVAGMFGFNLGVSLAGSATFILASGCGLGAAYRYSANVSTGAPGFAGANGGMGGGGGGGSNAISGDCYFGRAGTGCPYSGGSGGGGTCHESVSNNVKVMPTPYSGPGGKGGREFQMVNQGGYAMDNTTQSPHYGGGGAGNPGGLAGSSVNQFPGENGCGGKLTIICRGTVTVQSGGKIEANGMKGGSSQNYGGGGGSGGGHISIISPNAVSNAGTIQSAGGIGGANGGPDSASVKGGDGGAGSVVTKTFSDMGW